MKKIMFNDRYALTRDVLLKLKTQTRRILNILSDQDKIKSFQQEYYESTFDWLEGAKLLEQYYIVEGRGKMPYKVGEIVAVAESYSQIGIIPTTNVIGADKEHHAYLATRPKGWRNKMFVRADLMPHQIRITDVRIERLQDISDDDCLKEGVVQCDTKCPNQWYLMSNSPVCHCGNCKETPREAYAALIDKISGKGTWESNPFVWVYEFELIK